VTSDPIGHRICRDCKKAIEAKRICDRYEPYLRAQDVRNGFFKET